MNQNKNDTNTIEEKLKILEDRIKKLEDRIKNMEKKEESSSVASSNVMPQKRFDHDGKKPNYKPQPVTKKGEINVVVDATLNVVDEKGNIYKVGEELTVKNNLVMGDKLLVLTKDGAVETIKVSQRAKRVKEEALVTSKDEEFYAVSKFATHKLINYDVLSRGILKGFEIKIILPKDFEKNASVVLVDSVESSGGITIAKNENNSDLTPKPSNSNIRVVEDDDLV